MTPKTVLVIDDDPSARQTAEALLFPEGYDLVLADGGPAGLSHLERAMVDLVICDVMMPGMDGYEVTRQIKAHPTWRFVPVMLLTALDGNDEMVRGLEAGADEFVTKPVQGAVLRARARALLRVRDRYAELTANAERQDVGALIAARRERLVEAAGLTEREREVLDLVLLGRTHQDIATALGISERTSKFHHGNLLAKLGAESRNDLLRLFV
jgi:DNA-binding response OmpR family regulator